MPIFSQISTILLPKIEGTTTTFGQNIGELQIEQETTPTSNTTTQSVAGSVPLSSSPPSTPLSTVPKSSVSLTPPPVSSPPGRTAQQFSSVVPEDTIVKVVQNIGELDTSVNKFGDISSLPCKAKSNIAVVAASSNASAVAVLPKSSFESPILSSEKSLASSFLGDFSRSFPRVEGSVVVKGSMLKTKEEQKKILNEAQKVDLSISLKSKRSESIELNTLEEPALELDFVYNYFVESEGSVEDQEDQSKDPLVKNPPYQVPRYVELKWNASNVSVPLAGTEKEVNKNKTIRKESFSNKKGVFGNGSSNFRDSSSKTKKNANPLFMDGKVKKMTDTHKLEDGFDTLVNSKAFPNKVSVVVGTQEQKSTLNTIPFTSIKKI